MAPRLSISEVFKSFLMDTKNIVFFELISKKSRSFFKSLFFNKSLIYENSSLEICFFNGLISKFSPTNRIRLFVVFFKGFAPFQSKVQRSKYKNHLPANRKAKKPILNVLIDFHNAI